MGEWYGLFGIICQCLAFILFFAYLFKDLNKGD